MILSVLWDIEDENDSGCSIYNDNSITFCSFAMTFLCFPGGYVVMHQLHYRYWVDVFCLLQVAYALESCCEALLACLYCLFDCSCDLIVENAEIEEYCQPSRVVWLQLTFALPPLLLLALLLASHIGDSPSICIFALFLQSFHSW